MHIRRLATGVAFGALALAAANVAVAQQTTGSIRGQVTDDAGKPVAGATVTITHLPTGSRATAVTDAGGGYTVLNLRPGGPYTVEATEPAHAPQKVESANVALGATTQINLTLASGAEVAEVTVVASQVKGGIKVLTTGPRTAFGAGQIATLPALNRDIKEILARSPLVTLDPTNGGAPGALVVAGANNRVNTIYVDGVKQADDFGLNANGYPSQNEPFSIDWVRDLDFEVAPYDVQYGEFQGGLINVVTKEGSNSFHGDLYYQGNNSQYAGTNFVQDDGADQRNIRVTPFYKQTWGGDLGGPIIPDKLFFYGGYESYRSASVPNIFGPQDSNAANKVVGLNQADVDAATSIMKSIYNFDPLGDTSGTLPQTDTRWFARLDWNITDRQRLMVSYQEDDGVTLADGGSPSTSQLPLLSQFYNLDQNLKAYNVQLFSDWTDQFSTEFAFNRKEVASVRNPLAGNTFAQFQIRLDSGASIFLGPDISSQANVLKNTDTQVRFRAHYKLGDHVFTAGYEREALSVFNLFDQNANGAYVFATNTSLTSGVPCYPGFTVLQNLQLGQACSVTYANAASNVSTAAAANWSDVDNVLYVQDEWSVSPALTVRVGLRGEFYTDATPVTLNKPGFLDVYGFPNIATFGGRGVLMPRIGFNWRPDDSFTLTGGFGLFAGGDPNVWLSNSYTNTGLLIGSVNCSLSSTAGAPATTSCPPGALTGITMINGSPVVTGVVKGLNTASANSGGGITNFVDPNFQLPSTWKGSLSFVKQFGLPWIGDAWRLHGDFLYQQVNTGITWRDINLDRHRLGTAPDGRPTYDNARFASCGPTTHSCYSLELTNDSIGGGITWDLGLGKTWTDGWAKGIDFDVSYTHSNVGDANPGTSSVALSNYSQWAISDRDHPVAAPSNYNIKWQAQLKFGYTHAFWRDYLSSFQLFVEDRAGFPFSYTFFSTSSNNANSGDQMFGEDNAVAFRNAQLLYIPKADSSGNITAASDPRVAYNPTSFGPDQIAAFNRYLHQTGLIKFAGKIAPRNAFDSPDVLTGNLRFEQELPAFEPRGAKLKLWFDVVNFPNLINRKWGILAQTPFPNVAAPIIASNCQVNAPTKVAPSATACAVGNGNFYEYETFRGPTLSTLDNTSDWYMDLGIKYSF
ncbi:MAG TPA: carboxypeptidase regulatory-like domain-containing protein [Caulobacteraceae bacterium]|nr:carboxypeptidase regulatory-like domain-containing protein [Caulobacteraceae bacterium]